MGTPGVASTPKTPTALLTPNTKRHKDRLKTEPTPAAVEHTVPAPPGLNLWGKREWERTCALMVEAGMLCETDLPTLWLYCEALGTVHECRSLLERVPKGENGWGRYLVERAQGSLMRHPLQVAKAEAADRAVRYAMQLGLTPATRSNVSMTGVPIGGATKRQGHTPDAPPPPQGAHVAEDFNL